ncbi:MAG: hypothetical protein ACTHMG_09495 [Sphingomonas sp.]
MGEAHIDPQRRSPALSGFRRRRLREFHALPLGWRQLTGVELAHLKTVVSRVADTSEDLLTLEAGLLLWSSLVTGRQPAALLPFMIQMIPIGERLGGREAGVVGRMSLWGWWFPGALALQQKRVSAAMCNPAEGVYLPATQLTTRLLDRCVALRRRSSAGRFNLSGAPSPLFEHRDELLPQISQLLASRHPFGADRARRATTTPEAIARWLPAEILGLRGGDDVPASLITGQVATKAKTVLHYGAIRYERLLDTYLSAISPIDPPAHRDVPGELLGNHLGERLTPADAAVCELVGLLSADLREAAHDAAERHRAMTAYTVGLLCFALAHRGTSGSLPSRRAVHPETRLYWLPDKTAEGAKRRRLVWICDAAFDQLRLYEEHLDCLTAEVSAAAGARIKELRGNIDLALFDLSDAGSVDPLPVSEAVGRAMAPLGIPKNAGRHWLRAALVGRCSTETLYALFGHGPIDDASWDATSTLDPAVYRADLARVLDPALAGIGWKPRTCRTDADTP